MLQGKMADVPGCMACEDTWPYPVVRKVVEGRSNDEIGADLNISSKTVESHLRRIFERVGVASRTELATRAIREGWLDLPTDSVSGRS